MDKEYFLALAKVRMERAKELLVEAKELLDRESYKSANIKQQPWRVYARAAVFSTI